MPSASKGRAAATPSRSRGRSVGTPVKKPRAQKQSPAVAKNKSNKKQRAASATTPRNKIPSRESAELYGLWKGIEEKKSDIADGILDVGKRDFKEAQRFCILFKRIAEEGLSSVTKAKKSGKASDLHLKWSRMKDNSADEQIEAEEDQDEDGGINYSDSERQAKHGKKMNKVDRALKPIREVGNYAWNTVMDEIVIVEKEKVLQLGNAIPDTSFAAACLRMLDAAGSELLEKIRAFLDELQTKTDNRAGASASSTSVVQNKRNVKNQEEHEHDLMNKHKNHGKKTPKRDHEDLLSSPATRKMLLIAEIREQADSAAAAVRKIQDALMNGDEDNNNDSGDFSIAELEGVRDKFGAILLQIQKHSRTASTKAAKSSTAHDQQPLSVMEAAAPGASSSSASAAFSLSTKQKLKQDQQEEADDTSKRGRSFSRKRSRNVFEDESETKMNNETTMSQKQAAGTSRPRLNSKETVLSNTTTEFLPNSRSQSKHAACSGAAGTSLSTNRVISQLQKNLSITSATANHNNPYNPLGKPPRIPTANKSASTSIAGKPIMMLNDFSKLELNETLLPTLEQEEELNMLKSKKTLYAKDEQSDMLKKDDNSLSQEMNLFYSRDEKKKKKNYEIESNHEDDTSRREVDLKKQKQIMTPLSQSELEKEIFGDVDDLLSNYSKAKAEDKDSSSFADDREDHLRVETPFDEIDSDSKSSVQEENIQEGQLMTLNKTTTSSAAASSMQQHHQLPGRLQVVHEENEAELQSNSDENLQPSSSNILIENEKNESAAAVVSTTAPENKRAEEKKKKKPAEELYESRLMLHLAHQGNTSTKMRKAPAGPLDAEAEGTEDQEVFDSEDEGDAGSSADDGEDKKKPILDKGTMAKNKSYDYAKAIRRAKQEQTTRRSFSKKIEAAIREAAGPDYENFTATKALVKELTQKERVTFLREVVREIEYKRTSSRHAQFHSDNFENSSSADTGKNCFFTLGLVNCRRAGLFGADAKKEGAPFLMLLVNAITSLHADAEKKPGKWIAEEDSDFEIDDNEEGTWWWTSITANKNSLTSLHVDGGNLGPSLLFAVGDFIGGETLTLRRDFHPDDHYSKTLWVEVTNEKCRKAAKKYGSYCRTEPVDRMAKKQSPRKYDHKYGAPFLLHAGFQEEKAGRMFLPMERTPVKDMVAEYDGRIPHCTAPFFRSDFISSGKIDKSPLKGIDVTRWMSISEIEKAYEYCTKMHTGDAAADSGADRYVFVLYGHSMWNHKGLGTAKLLQSYGFDRCGEKWGPAQRWWMRQLAEKRKLAVAYKGVKMYLKQQQTSDSQAWVKKQIADRYTDESRVTIEMICEELGLLELCRKAQAAAIRQGTPFRWKEVKENTKPGSLGKAGTLKTPLEMFDDYIRGIHQALRVCEGRHLPTFCDVFSEKFRETFGISSVMEYAEHFGCFRDQQRKKLIDQSLRLPHADRKKVKEFRGLHNHKLLLDVCDSFDSETNSAKDDFKAVVPWRWDGQHWFWPRSKDVLGELLPVQNLLRYCIFIKDSRIHDLGQGVHVPRLPSWNTTCQYHVGKWPDLEELLGCPEDKLLRKDSKEELEQRSRRIANRNKIFEGADHEAVDGRSKGADKKKRNPASSSSRSKNSTSAAGCETKLTSDRSNSATAGVRKFEKKYDRKRETTSLNSWINVCRRPFAEYVSDETARKIMLDGMKGKYRLDDERRYIINSLNQEKAEKEDKEGPLGGTTRTIHYKHVANVASRKEVLKLLGGDPKVAETNWEGTINAIFEKWWRNNKKSQSSHVLDSTKAKRAGAGSKMNKGRSPSVTIRGKSVTKKKK
ncbi:unnamed protein product [Amoebophrya sp. A120]|nr:unnamed protein product [Amoebophrya sp. A120]|eukprot:GSA120T00010557001.1